MRGTKWISALRGLWRATSYDDAGRARALLGRISGRARTDLGGRGEARMDGGVVRLGSVG